MVTLEGTKRGRRSTRCALARGGDRVCERAGERAGKVELLRGPAAAGGDRTAPPDALRPALLELCGWPWCCQIALASRIHPSRPLRPPARRSPPLAPPPSATAPAQGPPGAQGCEGEGKGYQGPANACWCCLYTSFKRTQGHTLQACTLTQASKDALRPALLPRGAFCPRLGGSPLRLGSPEALHSPECSPLRYRLVIGSAARPLRTPLSPATFHRLTLGMRGGLDTDL